MSMDKSVNAVVAVALGALCSYACQLLIPLVILLAVILIDYCTGMVKAWERGELSSRIGIKGVIKKVSYLVVVCVAGVIDWLLHGALSKIGVDISVKFMFAQMVIVWLIINESISILENVAAIGGPNIGFMGKLLAKLKQQTEDKSTIVSDGEEEEKK